MEKQEEEEEEDDREEEQERKWRSMLFLNLLGLKVVFSVPFHWWVPAT